MLQTNQDTDLAPLRASTQPDTPDNDSDLHLKYRRNSSSQPQQSQYTTPRAQRYSQKLVEAAKKQLWARFPLKAPTDSASTTTLEPDRGSLTEPLSPQDLSTSSITLSTITTDPTICQATTGSSNIGKSEQQKPSKPKRRKLIQQRGRTRIKEVHGTGEILACPSTSTAHHQQRHCARLAEQKIRSQVATKTIKSKKPVVLGFPGGGKEAKPAVFVDDEQGGKDSPTCSYQRPRRSTTVEERLDKLISSHHALDLSQHSVIPGLCKSSPTIVDPIVISDDDDDGGLGDNVLSKSATQQQAKIIDHSPSTNPDNEAAASSTLDNDSVLTATVTPLSPEPMQSTLSTPSLHSTSSPESNTTLSVLSPSYTSEDQPGHTNTVTHHYPPTHLNQHSKQVKDMRFL
ncbi:hypothetical protein BC941DRAFT_434435 [Chlamydoabsidia padenii]|nr:hypothetical protein BC941DRAFT_434435 [Chlamydoabsidia padenii]